MTDRNGTPITVGARVRFACTLTREPWIDGWVRAVREHVYYHPRRVVWEARVDDGARDNADFATNGGRIAAYVESADVEVLP